MVQASLNGGGGGVGKRRGRARRRWKGERIFPVAASPSHVWGGGEEKGRAVGAGEWRNAEGEAASTSGGEGKRTKVLLSRGGRT